jgi:prepilin-type N-terminal cleavage/methylation domain-containing protein/prepilin-type processing-associated H-X9-DG protein
MFRYRTKSHGFTLVELLVVIAVIAILISLLLPAVQAARESARRTQCRNNLKQLGIALHNYHDVMRLLPPGYVAGSPDRSNTNPGWGWGAMLLPYLEQSALHSKLDFRLSLTDPKNATPVATFLPGFVCPSDIYSPTPFTIASDAAGTMPVVQVTPCSYVGCVGNDASTVDDNSVPWNGVLYRNSKTRISDITDGTTYTIVVGERAWCQVNGMWVGAPNTGLIQAGKLNRNAPSTETAAFAILGHAHFINGIGQDNDANMDDFSSMHPGGANCLFADGSVRYLQSTFTDDPTGWPAIVQAMGTRGGGEMISLDND